MSGLVEGIELDGRYLLIKPLRSGGRADVWQARDRRNGADVALKFNRCGSAGELAAEFSDLEALSDPAIVGVHRLAADGRHHFLVLDLVDGVELSQYMGADPAVWLPLLRRVVDGLAHAHGRGVVHGDLKLENILVAGNGSVRLVDFSGRPGLTAADDIRALGVVMSELGTGRQSPAASARLPAALLQLMTDISDNGANPMGLGAVAARLDEVLNDNMTPRETEQFERIEPVTRHVDVGRRRQKPTDRPRRAGWWFFGAGAVVIAAVAIVILVRPQIDRDSGETETATGRVDEAGVRLEALTAQTQKQSASVYQKWLALESMSVATWAELRAQRALELLQEAERLASDMNHVDALRLLGDSDALFSALLEQAPGIAADRREAGWQAFRAGDAEAAAAHFRVALAIEPNDQEVRAALNRTAILDEITVLTRQARELESNGNLTGALTAMQEALRIDSDNADFQQEVARLKSAATAAEFQKTMTQVFVALTAKDYSAARRSLRQASALRPQAPELRDATTQLELAERAVRIANLRARAVEAEKSENWEKAIELYSELLLIDPVLVLAREGRDRSRRLASLTARSEMLLDSSLIKESVRRQAEELLEQIDTVEADSPRLKSLAVKLTEALRLSRLPVTVRLQSDSLTDIQVYRVGRLGVFDSHELQLMPGEYTIVGTRAGYRDVRAELVVEAGKEPVPLIIRCEEQI